MEKKEEHMLKYYLIFNIFFISINILNGQDINEEQSIVSLKDSNKVFSNQNNYPGKPLIMSLVFPGAGQYYNKAPLWKTLSFLGVEISSLLLWNNFKNQAENLKEDYQSFANEHWTLNNWVNNRFNPPSSTNPDEDSWTSFLALNKLTGTHHLDLIISGTLENDLNLSKISSDSLEIHPDWIQSGDVTVVRDRHFYENIGKYDQFLGGWDDARSDWYWEEKSVGDSIEIIIKTPRKADYIDQRYKSNQMLNMAKYSITVIMFNHVISGIESVWYNQRKARLNKETNTDLSLTFNPYNSSGIGGVSLTFTF